MGWYGTPDGETRHFNITRDTIRETKERWRRDGEAKDDTTEKGMDRLDERGDP